MTVDISQKTCSQELNYSWQLEYNPVMTFRDFMLPLLTSLLTLNTIRHFVI